MTLPETLEMITSPIKHTLYFHKKKIGFLVLATIFFTIALFPFSDLTFFSQDKINQLIKRSGSQVSFSKINFSLFPFGIKTQEFKLSTKSLNPLNIQNLIARPNLLSLLKLNPGGTLNLDGILGGNIQTDFNITGKTEEDQKKFKISTEINTLSLKEILSFLNKPFDLKGVLNGSAFIEGEESFRQQPDGEFKLNLKNIKLPLDIPIGPISLTLPKKVIWKNSNLFGKIEKGRILIKNGTLGTKASALNGRYKGNISCIFTKGPNASCSTYDIKVELELDKDIQRELGQNFSSLISDSMVTRQPTPEGGMRYLFKVSGNLRNRFMPPKVQKISAF